MKKMKKVLATLLAASMVASMSFTAFADETTYDDMQTVTVTKTYEATNDGTTSPEETFSFTELICTGVTNAGVVDGNVVTKDNAPVPEISTVTYNKGAAGNANLTEEEIAALGDDYDEKDYMTQDITITLPEYKAVGIYTYTFEEKAGDTAGVTYYGDTITLVVTVIEQNGKVRVAAVHTEGAEEAKSDDFANEYSAGSLAVSKTVTGILGDKDKYFTVTVTFTAPEGETVMSDIYYTADTEDGKYNAEAEVAVSADTDTETEGVEGWTGKKTVTIQLKHDDTITFTNIPYGVVYSVVENDYSSEGYEESYSFTTANIVWPDDGTISGDDVLEFVVNDEEHTMGITNDKDGNVDTGIILDSAPYILLLALAGLGMFAVVSKKREDEI